MKQIMIFSILTALLFVGCSSKSVNTNEAKMVTMPSDVPFPYEIELTDIITYSTDEACNEADFLLYAREKKKVHRLIDVLMKSSCSSRYASNGQKQESCSCLYSGIGVKYRYSKNDKITNNREIENNNTTKLEPEITTTEDTTSFLSEEKTKVRLNTDPQGATVYINGKQMKNSTPTVVLFGHGEKNIRFLLNDVQKDTTITIDGLQKNLEINISLQDTMP